MKSKDSKITKLIEDNVQYPMPIEEKFQDNIEHIQLLKEYKKAVDLSTIASKTDKNGVIIYVNKAFLDVSGFTQDELIGSKHSIIRHPDNSSELFKTMWKTILNKQSWHGIIKNRAKDGSTYYVDTTIIPIIATTGEIENFMAIRHNITKVFEMSKEIEEKTLALKTLNENLENRINEEVEKNRMKDKQLLQQSRMAQMGEMISMIAHQWRQPLSAIASTSGFIELKASLNKLDNDMAQQKAHDISNFAQHLSKTIDDFRDFFKPTKKKEEISYDEILESVLEIIGISIGNENIELIQKLNCHEKLSTYANELKQVILNLLKNSADALLEKRIERPYIKISTYIEHDQYILEVRDNAGGIPVEFIGKIFDPYFSTKTEKEGTGLGLYMSKMIIEEHCNGELSVSNDDEGAVFRIIMDNR